MRTLVASLAPLASGLLFGIGLIVSGMTDPQRVLGFLDLFGAWNPALALVMGGAIAVSLPAFAYARRHGRTPLGLDFALPDRRTITPQLLGGSALFGLGWGLSGVCPGPGVILAAGGTGPALLFLGAMIGGMLLSDWLPQGRDVVSAEPLNGASAGSSASCG